ncbi:MAG: CoA ester lyase [Hyphomicrobiales bacterium]|nr:CoA ester lyase [Hyphomicrobiales bacterium]
METLLFVPGDSARKLEKALASGADALLIDLEDSVSLANKERARQQAREFVVAHGGKPHVPRLIVRINAGDSGLMDADLDAVICSGLGAVMLPKCCGGRDVQQLSARMALREAFGDFPPGSFGILPIVTETAASLFAMGSFAGASRRLIGLTWGAEDLAADLGATANRDENGRWTGPYEMARSLTLLAARAAAVLAIDTVFPDIADTAGFAKACRDAVRDGFDGKMAIHPSQIAPIKAAFTPSAAEIDHAHAILAAVAAADGAGVVALQGAMIDEPHLKQARKILARAASKPPS